jgi:hypothetical protein
VAAQLTGPVLRNTSIGIGDNLCQTDIFYMGSNHHLYLYNVGIYSVGPQDLTLLTGTLDPSGTALAAGIGNTPSRVWEQVIYIGTDHHVRELYRWIPGDDCGNPLSDEWIANDLSEVSGAEPAIEDSPILTFGANPIFYVSADKHVHEIYYVSGDTWKTLDVTHIADAPDVAKHSPLTGGNGAVFYFQGTGGIREVWCSSTTVWNTPSKTLNFDAGSPVPIAGSPLVWLDGAPGSEPGPGPEGVFYVSIHRDLYVLSGSDNGPWSATNITASSGAPKPRIP